MADSLSQLQQFMDSISREESGGNYNATNPSGAFGKYQFMPASWMQWAQEAGVDPSDHSPANQEAVARFEFTKMFNETGSWASVASEWFTGQPDAYKNNPGVSDGATSASTYVANVMTGMGDTSYASGGVSGGTGGPTGAPALQAPTPVTRDIHAPAGGILVHPTSGGYYLIYDVGGNGQQGGLFDPMHPPAGHVLVMYDYGTTNPNVIGVPPPVTVDSTYFDHLVHAQQNNLVQAGDVRELGGIPQGKSYQQWITDQLNVAAGGSQWVNDPEVRKLYFEFINNQIGQSELNIKIQQTAYYQRLSQKAQQWNNPATTQAEKDQEVADTASQLVQKYFDATGQMLGVQDPNIQSWALKIASGQVSDAQAYEQWIKPTALGNKLSPLSIQTQQTAHQGTFDVSQAKGQVRDLAMKWGVPYTDALGDQWAQKLVLHQAAPTDVEDSFRTQAKTLYPWIDPNVDVQTQAQPWLTTYQRVMEKPATIDNPDIQKALTAGTPVYQFEQDLKNNPDWLQTKNAMQDMTAGFGAVARQMGFEA